MPWRQASEPPMPLPKPKFPQPFRRRSREPASPAVAVRPAPAADEAPPKPVRELENERAAGDSAEAGWRASSYDLKHGLDVVELPTSLPADVLDRLFSAPKR